jgi:anthranilate phosphoribosyltransferase
MNIKHFLKDHAYQNIPLTFDEAYSLVVYAIEGCRGDMLAQIQSIAALSALHTQATYGWKHNENVERQHGHRLPKNSAEQIAGVCAAVFQQDIAKSEYSFLNPKVPYAMDNCGMGGDLIVTANVSTIAAFIASTGGIPMCKHGSPANADGGRHGSSDFISLLGLDTYATKGVVEKCLETEGFGYTEALNVCFKQIHLQTHEVAKLPHMNDIIGPITNPLCPRLMSRKMLGVNHLVSPRIVAEAYKILNDRGVTYLHHGLFVRGFADKSCYEGMDEVSICVGGTQVVELHDGVISEYRLDASDFGLETVPVEAISPPNGMSKGNLSLGILRGEITGPSVDMVLANTALLFFLAGRSGDLRKCTEKARDVYESGLVPGKVDKIKCLLTLTLGTAL